MIAETEEMVTIVDHDNNVVGEMTRHEMRINRHIHRSTYIFLQNSEDKFYVHKRTMLKKWYPGSWDLVFGGVVGAGES